YLGSGSEAMEAAIKLARQYHLERGEPQRQKLVARHFSYHGNTLGALAVGGHAARRKPYDPMLIDVAYIDPCYAYRYREPQEEAAAFGRRMADQLEAKLVELGPETVAAFIAEPVVGATLGTQPAASGYFKRIREICDRHGVLFIADEVMCGMGRTGSLFALEQEGIAADITTMAKGLGGGFQPIAALLARQSVCDVIIGGSGRLWNGHTYMSHATSCAGALAVLKVIEEDDLLANVRARGEELERGLRATLGDHDHIGDIRGRGLFWSYEVVADRETRAPFPAEKGIADQIKAAAMEDGIMCYPSQGCADGINGDHVLIAPAYITTAAEIEEIVSRLAAATRRVLDSVSVTANLAPKPHHPSAAHASAAAIQQAPAASPAGSR
ncbi:MAG: aspartate aminotransferase family protein, partial [Pseudomonadota bacterium]